VAYCKCLKYDEIENIWTQRHLQSSATCVENATSSLIDMDLLARVYYEIPPNPSYVIDFVEHYRHFNLLPSRQNVLQIFRYFDLKRNYVDYGTRQVKGVLRKKIRKN